MRKLLMLAFAMTFLKISSAYCGSLNYILENDTTQPIVRVWASPTTDPVWVETSNAYIAAYGGTQYQTFSSNAYGSDCIYDIKMQFAQGTQAVITGVNLCATSKLKIDVNYGQITYQAE